jgi:hypothetical protein
MNAIYLLTKIVFGSLFCLSTRLSTMQYKIEIKKYKRQRITKIRTYWIAMSMHQSYELSNKRVRRLY